MSNNTRKENKLNLTKPTVIRIILLPQQEKGQLSIVSILRKMVLGQTAQKRIRLRPSINS